MKSFSVFLLAALLVILIASDVKCEETCTQLNNICGEDELRCCEHYECILVEDMQAYFCLDNSTIIDNGKIKVQHGKCSYFKSELIKEETSSALNEKYTEFHASHALIPAGTKVNVSANHKWVIVVIDGLSPVKSTSQLELSDSAANALDIWENGDVSCDLQVQPEKFSMVKFLLKPAVVIVVYLSAVILSSYW